ncbi:heavy-metal-associated domain-containing protein [Flavobacterium sp.]|uniref:heavy-metal-associated domain-containing protein n=1 Tax=Flavobacterium sp. TaxID=239 RepID=UPI0039E378E0
MLQIAVENLKCEGCASSIEKALMLIDQVQKVRVELDKNLVIVTGDADRNEVIAKLTDLGYPEKGQNTLKCKAKSYLSCAVGRLT